MHAHQEVELKWALDRDGYRRLGECLQREAGPPVRLQQCNRFYDSTDRRLRAAGLNLRLREENGRLLLTCKRRVAQGSGLHHHEEWESPLDPLLLSDPPALATLPLPTAWRSALGDAPLELVGGFSNTRDEFRIGSDLLCLDRSEFPGSRIDYELEIETMDPAVSGKRWAEVLQAWKIPWTPQPLTKFARLLATSQHGQKPDEASPSSAS